MARNKVWEWAQNEKKNQRWSGKKNQFKIKPEKWVALRNRTCEYKKKEKRIN